MNLLYIICHYFSANQKIKPGSQLHLWPLSSFFSCCRRNWKCFFSIFFGFNFISSITNSNYFCIFFFSRYMQITYIQKNICEEKKSGSKLNLHLSSSFVFFIAIVIVGYFGNGHRRRRLHRCHHQHRRLCRFVFSLCQKKRKYSCFFLWTIFFWQNLSGWLFRFLRKNIKWKNNLPT